MGKRDFKIAPDDSNLERFATAIQSQRDELLQDWRMQVRRLPDARHLDVPTLNDHSARNSGRS